MASRSPASGKPRRPTGTKTPPRGTARQQPRSTARRQSGSTALRGTLDPHRDDLIGLVVIVAGVLLGLAVYLRLAGPVGGGIDTALGALVGVGRYVLPVALVGCGVALLLDGRSDHRFRLVFGVSLATVALLGLLHIARGPHEVATSPSAVDDA
ncbi:MAG TPA: hypothetical protein VID93_10495, partial [Acidimicrobiales bacterium]